MASSLSNTCSRQDCRLAERVLIVDDEPSILFAYRKLLERQGLAVDSCDCLCEALQYLQKHHYLAVVADMRLQGGTVADGLVLVREVRLLQPAAGVIVASASSDEQTRQAAYQLGASHYLEKPVHPLRILELLNRLRHAGSALTAPA